MQKPLRSVFLLCNGIPPSARLARRLRRACHLFIAADGGANAARRMRLKPDVIIGDLDSITPATQQTFQHSLILRVARQDNTDMEKALDFCVDQHWRRVTIAGATGGRMDMTLGNMVTVWRYAGKLDLVIAGDGWVAFPVRAPAHFAAPVGTTVSLIPFGEVRGVTLGGLRYPLKNATLKPGEVAVSNISTNKTFSIAIRRGNALVIVLHERATRIS
ncbi:MAG: thiamine diphosphokinase [Bacteroidota bacterium]